jgi:hypothetical protein
MSRLDDPAVGAAMTSLISDIGEAMSNLAARVAALPAQRAPVAAPIA